MSIYVFLGPTLPVDQARHELDAIYLPPVAQGDIFRLVAERPRAIGIVDGYFGAVRSVWHKELLWAMTKGIHLYGSSSMGALRAAETASFGMIGVGKIFQAFHNGTLEDDDEVAVTHLSQECGYKKLSTAMVNVRATVDAAIAKGIVSAASGLEFVRIAKSMFYPERCYESILLRSIQCGVPPSQVESFKAWLPSGEVDQKASDAIEMLRAIRSDLSHGLEKKQVSYYFEFSETCSANDIESSQSS